MPLAIVCSGQGSQHPEMFASLAAGESARPILEKAGSLLGIDLFGVPLRLDADALAANRTAQILVVAHALAAHAELSAEGVAGAVYAGYSAGEIAAHGCAGALAAEATLDLMAKRAALMDACVTTPQAMIATIGVSLEEARRAAAAAGAFVAIVNGPEHVVVGGSREAIDRYAPAVAPRARHMRRLGVKAASHTPLMKEAAAGFSEAVTEAGWRPPSAPTLSGVDGRAIGAASEAARYLSLQLHETIDWARCVECLFEYGATAVLEIGPGRALTKMIEEGWPDVPARAFEDFRTAAGAARWAARHA